MSDQFVGAPGPQEQYAPLARWLYQLLTSTPAVAHAEQAAVGEDVTLPSTDYHAAFYPQIPGFVMALLKKDSSTFTRYAPLFFHLIACSTCHRAYVETYDALRVALADEVKPATTALRQSPSTSLATTSPKLLVFLCQLLIEQARSVLHQAHRERSDEDAWARSLLQQAVQMSRYLMQGTMRQRALRNLVEVASLSQPSTTETPPGRSALSYTALVGPSSGARGRTLRRAEAISRPNGQAAIELRAGSLEGSITQDGEMLILHLTDLDTDLRGKFLLISIPLGTLLEPVRWLGGNPYAIRSSGPVGPDGKLTAPLGRTNLRLSNPEERNLIETLFKRLDVRPSEE